jgi:murein DD-endopeptidase MepM/ murein hydrolase activator NlpD
MGDISIKEDAPGAKDFSLRWIKRILARTLGLSGNVLAAVITASLGAACNNPSLPTPASNACLGRAVFGPAAQSVYVLPYPVGAAYEVLQSYCSNPGSHRNQLAYDFLMSEGTPVTAARGGIVVALVDQWEDTDWDSTHFNYVFIQHEDGTAAFYAHLQLHSLLVQLGARVNVGQPIGTSGHCGTPIADLHFGVYRTWPVADGNDLAVNFRNADGPLDSRGGLLRGVVYTALPY